MLLHAWTDWLARHDPSAFAVRDVDGTLVTRGELQATAERVAGALAGAGLGRGDRVAVLSKNSAAYIALYLGASKAGVTIVPINFRLVPHEWAHIVGDAGAVALLVGPDIVESVAANRELVLSVTTFVALAGPPPAGWVGFDDWIGQATPLAANPALRPGDDVVQMYTSGTTGLPKGALLTHDTLAAAMAQMGMCWHEWAQPRCLVVVPMYHVAAALTCFHSLRLGGSVYLMDEFDPVEVVRALDEEDVTFAFLAPAIIQMLLASVPGVGDRKYESLRMLGYGAAPMAEATLRQAIEVFGCEFTQGFGQTEATGGLTFLSHLDHQRALSGDKPELLRSCGRAVMATDVRVVNPDGREVAAGESGEILARGPQVMWGYWNLPDETAATLRDGWLHTGDVGYLDDEGYLYIQDRLKDMIVSGGENIYPAEVEQALFAHEAVADAAVVGVPHDTWGESVHAVVQRKPDRQVTDEDLVAFCRERLAGYKVPRSVQFVDAIPRNASMKVLKRELRAPFWADRERSVH